MEYKINPAAYSAIFAVPKAVVEENLQLASATALRVLLLVLSRSDEPLSVGEIAKTLKRDEEEITDALMFWQNRGLLVGENEPAKPVKASKNNALPPAKAEPGPAVAKKTAPELPLARPTHEQIAVRVQECQEFKELFREAEQILGKTIGYEGQSMLIMLHDTYDLPVEVIVMLLEYAKSKGKTGYKYIASVGREWSEKEIDSLESADEYIREQNVNDTLWVFFRDLSGAKNRNPTAKQRRFLTVWSKELGFSDEMIGLAYEICIDNTNKLSLEYMDKVLQAWHKKQIKTPADAERARQSWNEQRYGQSRTKRGKPTKQLSIFSSDASYDLEEFTKYAIGMTDDIPDV